MDRHDGGSEWLRIDVAEAAERGAARLVVAGELDVTTAGYFRRRVTDVLRQWSPATVEVDAGRLSSVDSTGLRCLLVCRRDAEVAGARLVVSRAAPSVYRELEHTGLLELFAVARRLVPPVADPEVLHTVATMRQLREQAAHLRQTARAARQRAAAARGGETPHRPAG